MNRWIDKVITRHLEPEHNVRPFLGGIFDAVSGDLPAFMDEEAMGSDEEKSGEGKTGTAVKRIWENEKGNENILQSEAEPLRDAGKVVKSEKELKNERNDLKREKTVPGIYKGKVVEGDKDLLPGAWKAGKGVEHFVKGEERILTGETGKQGADDAEVKGIPLMEGKTRTQVETKIKYVTREAPVLQDLSEGGQQVVRQAPGQGRTAVNVSGIVKGEPPVKQAIHVSIGRIEIKATLPPAEVKAASLKKDKDIMGLDQYLEQRNPAKQ